MSLGIYPWQQRETQAVLLSSREVDRQKYICIYNIQVLGLEINLHKVVKLISFKLIIHTNMPT